MARLVNEISLKWKSGILGVLLLLPACFTAGQMYQRGYSYNAAAGGYQSRGAYPTPQHYWAGRRWNSVQQLSNAVRANESQRYALSGTPAQSSQPQMASSQSFANPTASFASHMANSQALATNGMAPYQTPASPYEARNMVSSYPGANIASSSQYSEAINPQGTPAGTRQPFYASGTGPSTSSGVMSSVPTSQYNNGAGANRSNGTRPMPSRPSDANFRYPGSGRYTQSGRTTSSFMGIASGDPYTSYSSGGRQGSQTPADQAENGAPGSNSAGTSNDEETQPTESEDGESTEVESSGRTGVRRVMNPYDLSHIFPDIYQEEQPASYDNLTNQSLALLEMTTINSTNDE